MLTAQDLQTLKRTFKPSEHEFKQKFVYIAEGAVSDRIEEVDPSWTFEILASYTRDNQAVVNARLTIKGVSRDGVGMQDIKETAGEPEKGAATDALKRCARLFGIGRYLLDVPGNVTNMDTLNKWLTGGFSQNTATQSGAQGGQATSGQNAANSPQNAQETELIATRATVMQGRNNKPYLMMENDTGGKVSLFTRDPLRAAGYDCESWTEVGKSYSVEPPAALALVKDGQYWKVVSAIKADSAVIPF